MISPLAYSRLSTQFPIHPEISDRKHPTQTCSIKILQVVSRDTCNHQSCLGHQMGRICWIIWPATPKRKNTRLHGNNGSCYGRTKIAPNPISQSTEGAKAWVLCEQIRQPILSSPPSISDEGNTGWYPSMQSLGNSPPASVHSFTAMSPKPAAQASNLPPHNTA